MKCSIQKKYWSNGNIKHEIHYDLNGMFHREDGPAIISYYYNGNIKRETYYINGKKYRKDGPTNINYHGNGSICMEQYCVGCILHREDGPAWIVYYKNGDVQFYNYYIKNTNVTSQYEKYKKRLTKRMIDAQCKIELLLIMRLVCKENNNKELLDLVESKIIALELSK